MTTIAVVGPGSVGTYFAAHFAAAGNDVVSCARRPFTEYVVESTTDYGAVRGPARVAIDPSELEPGDRPADWVLVAVKAQQTEGARPWLDALCGPETTVIVAQNGVEGVERVTPFVHGAAVLAAVVYCGAELLEPGHVQHHSAGHLILPDVPAAHALAALAEGSGAQVRPSAEYVTEAWRKLSLNVVVNGISGLTLEPMQVLRRPPLARLAERLLTECWTVAQAEGADLDASDPKVVADLIAAVAAQPGNGGTSTLYDRRAGRPTEHDALHGSVVRAAHRHGIAVPAVSTLDELLSAFDPT